MAATGWEDDDWEAVDNDGFVYKRRKRLRPDNLNKSTEQQHDNLNKSREQQHDNLKKRKKDALLKVRERYQAEIAQWELLSNTSKALFEKTQKKQQRLVEEASTSANETSSDVGFGLEREGLADSGLRRRIDELSIRVEADHATIQVMSNLCDTAEAICNAQEQRLRKEFLDIPIWASPRDMMAVLCDTHSKADNGEGDTRSG